MTKKKAYKIGWKDRRNSKWHYMFVMTKSEMLEEVADKIIVGNAVSVREVEVYCMGD